MIPSHYCSRHVPRSAGHWQHAVQPWQRSESLRTQDGSQRGPVLVPRVKRAVQALDLAACQRLVAEIRTFDSASAILARCEQVAREHYAELL